jgi:general secretion pathway protein B
MSYILDALRKADAQRSRDPARGIHAQPASAAAVATDTGRRKQSWIVGAVSALLLVAAGWMWLAPGAPPRQAPVAAVAVAPAVAVDAVRAPPAPVMPASAVMPPAPEPVAAVAPVAPAIAPARPAASAAAPVQAAGRTFSMAELPADVQQALPKFAVSGGVYSENVAQRMLIVNGQVFSEGSEIAPGVVLEQVRPRIALLRFRGLRISQPY